MYNGYRMALNPKRMRIAPPAISALTPAVLLSLFPVKTPSHVIKKVVKAIISAAAKIFIWTNARLIPAAKASTLVAKASKSKEQ